MKLLNLSTLLATLATAISHGAVLSNGSFETGITGWTEAGGSGLFTTVPALTGAYGSVNPTDAGNYALISNNGVSVETVSQTFDITAGLLSLNYRFLTDEHNTGANYNDFATIVLTIGGTPTTLATISRNDLQAGGEGSLLPGGAFLDNTQNSFDIGQAAWQTATFNTAGFIGQSATLTFQVSNVGGSDLDIGVSQLAVDHVQQVPEAGISALIAAAGLAGLRRRRH